MPLDLSILALAAAATVSGLVAGVFLTFSDFVMSGLGAATPAAGMAAMQGINRKVYGSVFLVLFMALAPAALVLALFSLAALPPAVALWSVAAAFIYITGVFGVTAIRNVPMNKRLDVLAAESTDGQAYWADYAQRWTGWNHVRTLAALATTLCYVMAFASAA